MKRAIFVWLALSFVAMPAWAGFHNQLTGVSGRTDGHLKEGANEIMKCGAELQKVWRTNPKEAGKYAEEILTTMFGESGELSDYGTRDRSIPDLVIYESLKTQTAPVESPAMVLMYEGKAVDVLPNVPKVYVFYFKEVTGEAGPSIVNVKLETLNYKKEDSFLTNLAGMLTGAKPSSLSSSESVTALEDKSVAITITSGDGAKPPLPKKVKKEGSKKTQLLVGYASFVMSPDTINRFHLQGKAASTTQSGLKCHYKFANMKARMLNMGLAAGGTIALHGGENKNIRAYLTAQWVLPFINDPVPALRGSKYGSSFSAFFALPISSDLSTFSRKDIPVGFRWGLPKSQWNLQNLGVIFGATNVHPWCKHTYFVNSYFWAIDYQL